MSIYVGDGLKFDHKTKSFPLQPPVLVPDEFEYEEFVLPPEKKEDPVEQIIQKTVDNIWDEFDTDGNGYLDRDEAESFIKKTLLDIKENEPGMEIGSAGEDQDAMDAAFEQFDKNGDGRI